MKKIIILTAVAFLVIPTYLFAHPGRTDSSGCHTCRTNCASWGLSTGEYHCHQSKGVTQPIEPVKSIKAEQKTVPAPEYAVPKKQVQSKSANVVQEVTPVKKKIATGTTKTLPVSYGAVVEKNENQVKSSSWVSRFFSWLF